MVSIITSALPYLKGQHIEQKIVGVIMVNNILSNGNDDINQIIKYILTIIDPLFIIQMIHTPDINEKSEIIQLAGLNFIGYACNSHENMVFFLDYIELFIKTYYYTKYIEVRLQSLTIIKLLNLFDNTNCKAKSISLFLHYLSNNIHTKNTIIPVSPIEILQLISDIINIKCNELNNNNNNSIQIIKLTEEESNILILLIIQNLNSNSITNIRGETIKCCKELLYASRTLQLDASWTISSKDTMNFPQFLCSIISNEIHIILDELLFLYTNSPQSLSDRYNMKDNNNDIIPDSLLNSMKELHLHEKDHNKNIINDIEYYQHQLDYSLDMFLVCLQLIDIIVIMLIGDDVDDDLIGCNAIWIDLPYNIILKMKEYLYQTIYEIYDFIKDSSNIQNEVNNNINNNSINNPLIHFSTTNFINKNFINNIICVSIDTLYTFLLNDFDTFATIFINHLPYMISFDYTNIINKQQLDNDNKQIQLQSYHINNLCNYEKFSIDLKSELLVDYYTIIKSNINLLSNYHIILPLIPALTITVNTFIINKEVENDNNIEIDSMNVEQLLDHYPVIMPCIVKNFQNSINCLCSNINNINILENDSMNLYKLLHFISDISILLTQLIKCYEMYHPNEISILLQSEGDITYYNIFSIHKNEFLYLYDTCITLISILKQSINMKDKESYHNILQECNENVLYYIHSMKSFHNIVELSLSEHMIVEDI